jgi:hypothetical protein
MNNEIKLQLNHLSKLIDKCGNNNKLKQIYINDYYDICVNNITNTKMNKDCLRCKQCGAFFENSNSFEYINSAKEYHTSNIMNINIKCKVCNLTTYIPIVLYDLIK